MTVKYKQSGGLNSGPKTEVLFMARPTLSKTLYLQQLGREMRKCKGKEYLIVFDFIDNANMFNMPYSLHRIFTLKEYKTGEYVVAPQHQFELDRDLIAKGEKPHIDENGRVFVEDIVNYFMNLYGARKEKGLVVEKKSSIFCKDGYSKKDVERNIFANPFKRFEDMRFMKRCREIEYVEFNRYIFRKLSQEEKEWIVGHCDEKLEEYYNKRLPEA